MYWCKILICSFQVSILVLLCDYPFDAVQRVVLRSVAETHRDIQALGFKHRRHELVTTCGRESLSLVYR